MNKNYIILPTYNDWKSLNKVLITLNKTHINSFKKTSVLVVNDCSDIKFKFNKKKFNKINSFKILNLKKNVGSQKSIFIALKYLQKRLGRKNNKCIISILDSDGEDDPYKLKKLTSLAVQKDDYFIFASRKQRTENIIFKTLNYIRLIITFFLTGKFINFGNFSSFSSKILKHILKNNNLSLAYSSGVIKNYKKIICFDIEKKKRYFGSSKVNIKFLIFHSINIISVFTFEVLIRTFFILLFILLFLDNNSTNFLLISIFIILNLFFFIFKIFFQNSRNILDNIKSVKKIK